jgi:hypothetical protein
MADPVYWGTRGFERLADSRGAEWRADFQMRIGVFRAGFTPGPDNVEQWQAQWIELGVAAYDVEERRYAGVVDDSAALPDGAGKQVYLWAGNGTNPATGPEWLLLTHPDWVWGGKAAKTATPAKTWIADEASLAIIGGISTGSAYLTSASVRPAVVPMDEWLAAFFPNDAQSATADADPDADGISNKLEYFLGTDPTQGSSIGSPEIRLEAAGVRLSLNRNPQAVSTFVLETSNDLQHWLPAAAETVANRPDRVEVLAPRDAGAKSVFYRFQLPIPAAE